MYSRNVTELALRRAERKLGIRLRRHPLAFVERSVAHLDALMQDDGTLRRPLTPDERAFIRNERLVCKMDYLYWASRYARIKHFSENRLVPYVPNVAQQIMNDIRAEMEEEGIAVFIQQLKARQLGACLTPDTKILTADLQWVPLGDVRVGAEIVAVDEYPLKTPVHQNNSRRMRTAVIEGLWRKRLPTCRMTFEDGTVIVGTPQHPWLCRARRGIGVEWRKAGDIRTGDLVRRVCHVWGDSDKDDAWLGGLIDGEGCLRVKKGAGVELSVSQVAGSVLERAKGILYSRYAHVREEVDRRKGGTSSKLGNKPVHKLVAGCIPDIFKLVGKSRPTRFVGMHWWDGKELPGSRYGSVEGRVVAIEPCGDNEIVDLQTSTGTFIAEGLVSHNTTDTEMCIAHRVQFHTHVEAVVASSRPEKSEEMSNKMVLCWQNQPWWLLPRETASRAGSLIEFGELHSAVSIQHGAQLTGIARGRTPNVVHLSELCEYENPEELVDASLLRAVHHSPSTFFVMESTALGIGNWWHDTWLVSKEGWPSRTSDFRPIFLPWFVGSDIYPDDIWLKAHPIPPNWQPSEVALAHAQRCREFVQRNDLLRRHLGFNWSLPRRQLWWWEVERNIALKKRQLSKFYMETPADDVEAFQNTNPSVFEPETIELLHKDTHSPLAVFGFRGSPDHFPLAIQPDLRQIDPEAPILPVRAQCSQAYRPVHADLVPLKFQGYSGYNEMGKLFVWELPEEGSEYGLGVDTSEGVGQDRSVIQVIRKATLDGRPPAQVAEFASPRLNSLDLFPFVFIVGQFYSTRRRDGGLARPRMVIECRWNGENVQVELQKHGWPNFHKWTRYHKTKYNLAQERNLGWYSNAWSRPMMMDYFIKALRDQMFMAPSPFLVSELSTLEIDEAGQTIKALHGRHDDRVMACGIVYFSLHILETGGIMQPMSAQRIRSKVAPVYSPPYQQMDNQDVSGADIWTPDERLQVEGDE